MSSTAGRSALWPPDGGSADPWARAYRWIRQIEAGWADDSEDPGGPTYAGITIPAVVGLDLDHDGQFDFDLDGDGDVDRQDLEILRRGGHDHLIERFYLERYWNVVRAPELPWPWSVGVFDAAVHSGPGPAVLLLQQALGVKRDGKVGPKTLEAVRRASHHHYNLLFAKRSTLFRRICERRGWTFWDGWMIRLFLLRDEAGRPLGGNE